MKKVLLITSRLPYPPYSGMDLKNYKMLEILSKYYEVYLLSFYNKNNNKIDDGFYKWLKNIGVNYKVINFSKFMFLKNVVRSFFNSKPLQVNYYYSPKVGSFVGSIINKFDIIIVSTIRIAEYIETLEKKVSHKTLKILDMADLLSLSYERSKKQTNSIFWKIIYWFESRRLPNYEKKSIEFFDKTLLFNKKEATYYNYPQKVKWIPHGVKENLFVYNNTDKKYSNYVVFFGKMDYQPNVDAAIWFANKVLPNLTNDLIFAIVGIKPSKKILKLKNKYKNIVITGFVEDPYIILKSSLCCVAPMQNGGGIQNKVLEAMALGTINIVSSIAATPIGGNHLKQFLVADSPEDYIKYINDIKSNVIKYNKIKENAQIYIKQNFTWEIYEKKLLKILEE